jgi:hypothetical protein
MPKVAELTPPLQFKRLPLLPPRTIDLEQDLPLSSDYEYTPRPPKATPEKLITQHEFEVYVRLCLSPCWVARFLPFTHECSFARNSAVDYIDKLPKYNKMLDKQVQDAEHVWGIQARYIVSGIRVVMIHVFIMLVSGGFWVWWQWGHLEDLQGAAVPFTAVFLLVSTFWSATGVLKDYR